MAASCKQIKQLLRRDVVQQIVEDSEAWFAAIIVILLYTPVIYGVCGQLLMRRNRGLLAVTPDFTEAEFSSVQSESNFCSKRMQNDVLPEPLDPLTTHAN